jgi:hypothetical protein
MSNRKLPNDITLIIHRYVHRFHVSKLNIHYRSIVFFDSTTYNVLKVREKDENNFKSYNYRTLHVVNLTKHLKWSVFNRKRVRVCELPKNY